MSEKHGSALEDINVYPGSTVINSFNAQPRMYSNFDIEQNSK